MKFYKRNRYKNGINNFRSCARHVLGIEKMEYKKQINRIKNKNLYDKNEKPLIDERPHQPKGNQQILTDSK